MIEFQTRSPYLLETAKGKIELSKGMYLSLIRRRAQQEKNTKKKTMEAEADCARTAMRTQNGNLRKTIFKLRTTKKNSRVPNDGILCRGMSVSLSKGNRHRHFNLYEDSKLFPQNIQNFQINQTFDNDCDSDEEEIRKSLNSVLMSLCIAAYDNKFEV